MNDPTTNPLLEGAEGNRASKLRATPGTIWAILRHSNSDASKIRSCGKNPAQIQYWGRSQDVQPVIFTVFQNWKNKHSAGFWTLHNRAVSIWGCTFHHPASGFSLCFAGRKTQDLCEASFPVSEVAQKSLINIKFIANKFEKYRLRNLLIRKFSACILREYKSVSLLLSTSV